MAAVTGLNVDALREYGLSAFAGANVDGTLIYERPAVIHQPARLKDCSLGAFSYINSRGSTSAYRCHFGRFAQVGEDTVIGPPEHPQDWFSNHPFAFTQPEFMPHLYRMPEFARLMPDDDHLSRRYIAGVATETLVGHETYIGTKSFVRRGVKIGHGAVLAAGSVVLEDVPPYAIVAGTPARIMRLRYDKAIVERLLALQWWHYDLAPYKNDVDFSRMEETLAFFERRKSQGQLEPLEPKAYSASCREDVYTVEHRKEPLYDVSTHADYPAVDATRPPPAQAAENF